MIKHHSSSEQTLTEYEKITQERVEGHLLKRLQKSMQNNRINKKQLVYLVSCKLNHF